ncbi:hypothetical protein [uncultured Cellulomonas sp.]|uniref:hypothetical protein n=1 Tax=uncultured Cellulomonas sp. TaxID=189682 RepID=UPI002618685A|nr:hypothetical protein [uncultured Cellulomonas sp.]
MTHHAPARTSRSARRRPGSMAPVTAALAPGVDPGWADDFILELRMLDVPGRAIGDALVEVGSHCADSGEGVREAFGDPVAYARTLALPPVPVTREDLGPVLPWVLPGTGLLLVSGSASTVRTGEPLELTSGLVAAAVLLLVGVAAALRWFTPVVRFVVQRPVLAWAAAMAHLGVLVVLFLVLRDVLVTVPGALALTAGGVLVVAGTVWQLVLLHGDVGADDPVSATVHRTAAATATGTDGRGAPGPHAGGARWGLTALRYGGALLVPAAALVLVAIELLLR